MDKPLLNIKLHHMQTGPDSFITCGCRSDGRVMLAAHRPSLTEGTHTHTQSFNKPFSSETSSPFAQFGFF